MNSNFISNLQKKRCNYNHPDQATSQANSLILLSSGIYTEEERFVFELLQNAVDAHNEESKMLDVKMIIKDGYFIFFIMEKRLLNVTLRAFVMLETATK